MADWVKNSTFPEDHTRHLFTSAPTQTGGSYQISRPQPKLINFSAAPDKLFDSKLVYRLTRSNFNSFLQEKDIAMVFFYTTLNQETLARAWEINKASKVTQRKGHAYAAVNCGVDSYFCEDLEVASTPQFKLYSKGNIVGSISNPADADFEELQDIMQNTSV